jgi:polyferredoxin
MGPQSAASSPLPVEKKKLVRRTSAGRAQTIRRAVQTVFVLLNLWLGAQFLLWVHWVEGGGTGLTVSRPAGAEGWLPIAGLMNLKLWILTGEVPAVHPAAMFLLLAFLLMSLLLKKAFCSWLCPVGTFSEFLWKAGRRIFGRSFHLPRLLDIPLRGLKYLLLGFFVFIIGTMSAAALNEFMQTPYGLIADVKMLNFFRHIGTAGLIVLAALGGLSLFIQNFWCRYLCPYGALMGLVSLLSPMKIRRDASVCLDCGKCTRSCPAALPVDKLVQIRSAECTACMACVDACPAEHALQFALPPRNFARPSDRWYRRAFGPRTVAGVMAVIFLTIILLAKLSGHWQTHLPDQLYFDLVPRADSLSHPMR